MKKDHQLGDPEGVAMQHADADSDFDWGVDPYPFGMPERVIAANREALDQFVSGMTAPPHVIAFETNDHKEDGTQAEAVSDAEILRNVGTCLASIKTHRDLHAYYGPLLKRLLPRRSVAFVDELSGLYRVHSQRIHFEEQSRKGEALPTVAQCSDRISRLARDIVERKLREERTVCGVLHPSTAGQAQLFAQAVQTHDNPFRLTSPGVMFYTQGPEKKLGE